MANFDHLAPRFKALAYPTRLKLLSKLKEARPITDLELTTSEDGRERTMTREGVRHHMLQLHEAGLVEATTRKKGGQNQKFYRLRPQGLFSLSESLVQAVDRDVQSPLLREGSASDSNSEGESIPASSPSSGPSLAIVHGIGRGHRFLLSPSKQRRGRGWVIGSSPKCDIVLSFDEEIDDQHAEILPSGDEFKLLDLRTSGSTELNWTPLDLGGEATLQAGDVIGIGSTLLVFQARGS